MYPSGFYISGLELPELISGCTNSTANNYDSEANILIEKMNGELMSQRPTPTLKGLTRIGYDKEINITHSLEEYFILHLVSSKI